MSLLPDEEMLYPPDGDDRKVGRVAFRQEINPPVSHELDTPTPSPLQVVRSMDEVRRLIAQDRRDHG